MSGREPSIEGFCEAHFAPVRAAFAANFTQHAERGGAVAIAHDGRLVVDLWGGFADVARTERWMRDTVVNFFSVSKALCTVAALGLVERGKLALDEPVVRTWPEFGASGKTDITLRHILCHRSALPALREPLADDAMLEWSAITSALARETPWWQPGSAHGYHVNTFGFLLGELVRRASGMSIGNFLRREIAGPLGADVHIGLPASEHRRCAEFLWPAGSPKRPEVVDDATLMRWNTYWNPAGFSGGRFVNTKAWREAEIPSTNGHGNARGIARVYAALANGGEIDGVRILSREILTEATTEHSAGPDLIAERATRFGLGFQLTQRERPLGPNPGAFGHFGAGGSLGFCDPQRGIAFGYVTNDMGPRWQNPRNRGLIDALYSSL